VKGLGWVVTAILLAATLVAVVPVIVGAIHALVIPAIIGVTLYLIVRVVNAYLNRW
jgi:hypothetical protein